MRRNIVSENTLDNIPSARQASYWTGHLWVPSRSLRRVPPSILIYTAIMMSIPACSPRDVAVEVKLLCTAQMSRCDANWSQLGLFCINPAKILQEGGFKVMLLSKWMWQNCDPRRDLRLIIKNSAPARSVGCCIEQLLSGPRFLVDKRPIYEAWMQGPRVRFRSKQRWSCGYHAFLIQFE